jgi:hypothetical protein
MHIYWASFLVGWLIKTITLRYGGLQLYRKLIPLATGMIMGDMAGRALMLAATVSNATAG